MRLGCTGWDYDTVLQCYLRSEDQRSRGAGPYHAVGGPLAVSDPAEPHRVVDAFIDAAEQAGIPRNPDFNGATQEGAGYYQTMTRNGRRCSAAMAFVHPVKHRANLTVMTGARVEKVLFDEKFLARTRANVARVRERFFDNNGLPASRTGEWTVFAGFAFYIWWRLVKDAYERELEEQALASAEVN